MAAPAEGGEYPLATTYTDVAPCLPALIFPQQLHAPRAYRGSPDMNAALRHAGQLSLAFLVVAAIEQRHLADRLAGQANTVILRRLERDLTRNSTHEDPANSAHSRCLG